MLFCLVFISTQPYRIFACHWCIPGGILEIGFNYVLRRTFTKDRIFLSTNILDMLHRIAIGIAFCMLQSLVFCQDKQTVRVYFDYDKYELGAEGRRELLKLPQDRPCTFIVSGHTDSRGTNAYNQNLSKNRMEEVRLFLLDNGATPDRLESHFYGEEAPWKKGEDEKSWKMNRRVDVECLCPEKIEETTEKLVEESVDELLALLEGAPSTYFVTPNRDTTLYLEKGGILHLKANSLDGDFKEGAEVEIRVKEYYTLGDMVLGNLNTRWKDKPLESGGMVWVEVLLDGEPVDLKPEARYKLEIPVKGLKKEGMGLYYGSGSPNANLTWSPGQLFGPMIGGGLAPRLATGKMPGRFRLFLQSIFNRDQWAYWQEIKKQQEEISSLPDSIDNVASMSEVSREAIEYYVLQPKSFGYINCDRYVSSRQQLVAIHTNLPQSRAISARLIIPADKSIMPSYYQNELVYFPNIPIGKACKVMAFKVEGDKYFIGESDIKASNEVVEVNEWEEMTLEDLKARVHGLDEA